MCLNSACLWLQRRYRIYEFAFLGVNFTQHSVFGSLDFYVDLIGLDFDDGFAFMDFITCFLASGAPGPHRFRRSNRGEE
jgi:hypothetical protein